MAGNLDGKLRLPHIHFRVLLHATNMRHGTNDFTSLPKEGVVRIFFALKNPTASAGFEPANLGTKGQHATSRPPKTLMFWDATGRRTEKLKNTSPYASSWSKQCKQSTIISHSDTKYVLHKQTGGKSMFNALKNQSSWVNRNTLDVFLVSFSVRILVVAPNVLTRFSWLFSVTSWNCRDRAT